LNPRVVFDIHSKNNIPKDREVAGREFAFVGGSLWNIIIWISILNLLEDGPVNIFGKLLAIPLCREDRCVQVSFDFSRIYALVRESPL